VPSRFPPVGLFDRVADAKDLEAVYALEALTNDRVREEAGDLALVPPKDRIVGSGTTPIMAAFTHLNPEGSRFSDGSYGVYYCAEALDTALAEVRYHQERFLRRTNEGPSRLELRLYLSDLEAKLVDVRRHSEFHDPDDCRPGERLGRELRAGGKDGVLYRSVRHSAAMRGRLPSPGVERLPPIVALRVSLRWRSHCRHRRTVDGLSSKQAPPRGASTPVPTLASMATPPRTLPWTTPSFSTRSTSSGPIRIRASR
jgi:hypothetical protein